jgi:hypothetical protein
MSTCQTCATSGAIAPSFKVDRLRKIVRAERLDFALFDSATVCGSGPSAAFLRDGGAAFWIVRCLTEL